MRLSHNMFSLSIYNNYKGRIQEGSKALAHISSGNKINSAKDNPGKLGASETLKIQVMTNDAANRNIQDANSMIQTFDSALQEINDNLARMKELTVSAGSGSLTPGDKAIIQKEIDSVKKNIEELGSRTEFNGIKLCGPAATGNPTDPTSTLKAAIGTMEDENMNIPLFDISTKNFGIDTLDITNVDASIAAVDKANKIVSNIRSKYGALQNRLEGTSEYLSSKDITIQTAQSRIADADIAEEIIQYSKSQLLVQASQGLLAQSNNFPKDALNILGNVK